MGAEWITPPTKAFPELFDEYARTSIVGGNRAVHRQAAAIQEWGRANAPWTDRTGNARRLLTVRVEGDEFAIGSIVIEHGVDYGLWLEIANAGKYAIITKMIDMFAPVLWRDLQRVMNLGLATRG